MTWTHINHFLLVALSFYGISKNIFIMFHKTIRLDNSA